MASSIVFSSIYDHWGLDNIGVSATTCGNYQITWLHDNYSLPTGTYNGTNPNGVSPTSNTSYVVQMTNGITTCYDTINVVVDQPVLTTNDVTICEGRIHNLKCILFYNWWKLLLVKWFIRKLN